MTVALPAIVFTLALAAWLWLSREVQREERRRVVSGPSDYEYWPLDRTDGSARDAT